MREVNPSTGSVPTNNVTRGATATFNQRIADEFNGVPTRRSTSSNTGLLASRATRSSTVPSGFSTGNANPNFGLIQSPSQSPEGKDDQRKQVPGNQESDQLASLNGNNPWNEQGVQPVEGASNQTTSLDQQVSDLSKSIKELSLRLQNLGIKWAEGNLRGETFPEGTKLRELHDKMLNGEYAGKSLLVKIVSGTKADQWDNSFGSQLKQDGKLPYLELSMNNPDHATLIAEIDTKKKITSSEGDLFGVYITPIGALRVESLGNANDPQTNAKQIISSVADHKSYTRSEVEEFVEREKQDRDKRLTQESQ